MIRLKILIATHKETILPFNEIFLPIHVGSKNANQKLNIQRDDVGINISEKNPQYCELTAIYWAFKNLNDYDYIGLFHYRRFLTFERISLKTYVTQILKYNITKFIRNTFLNHHNYIFWPRLYDSSLEKVENNDYIQKLIKSSEAYEIISLKPVRISSLNVKSFWGLAFSTKIFDILEPIISQEYPNMLNTYLELISGNKIYPCSIFIFKKSIFDEYSEFIFAILFALEVTLKKENITPLPRTLGYLGEILTSTFIIYKEKNGTKIKKLNLLEIS